MGQPRHPLHRHRAGALPHRRRGRAAQPGRRRHAGKADPTIPLNRNGEMRELANLAVYLLDPGSAYVNGQTIAIDGGSHLKGGGGFARLAEWGDAEWEAGPQRHPRHEREGPRPAHGLTAQTKKTPRERGAFGCSVA